MLKYIDVSKVGKAKVVVDIVEKGNYEIRPAYAMNPSQIAIHNTGNAGKGANATMHNRYIHNMAGLTPAQTGYASWHYSVDDKYIYQHIPMNESAWHTGDGSGATSGNRTAIGIEICENPDMDYAQAEENAIALTVYLMNKFNIGISKVKPHQAFSGKWCPRVILNRDGTFTRFRNRIESAYKGKPVVSGGKPDTTQTDEAPKQDGSYKGKRVESIYSGKDGINFYSRASFNTKYKVGVIQKGIGFPNIVSKVRVGTGYMYKVKNSKGNIYYVTASTKYVKVVGGSTASKPAKKPASTGKVKVGQKVTLSKSASKYATGQKIPASIKGKKYTVQQVKSDRVLLKEIVSWVYTKDVGGTSSSSSKSKIKSVGKIKMTGVSNFTYIYASTSDKSKKLGKAKKNATFNIAGSVTGWYEVIYKGKRAYIKTKYASRV